MLSINEANYNIALDLHSAVNIFRNYILQGFEGFPLGTLTTTMT